MFKIEEARHITVPGFMGLWGWAAGWSNEPKRQELIDWFALIYMCTKGQLLAGEDFLKFDQYNLQIVIIIKLKNLGKHTSTK